MKRFDLLGALHLRGGAAARGASEVDASKPLTAEAVPVVAATPLAPTGEYGKAPGQSADEPRGNAALATLEARGGSTEKLPAERLREVKAAILGGTDPRNLPSDQVWLLQATALDVVQKLFDNKYGTDGAIKGEVAKKQADYSRDGRLLKREMPTEALANAVFLGDVTTRQAEALQILRDTFIDTFDGPLRYAAVEKLAAMGKLDGYRIEPPRDRFERLHFDALLAAAGVSDPPACTKLTPEQIGKILGTDKIDQRPSYDYFALTHHLQRNSALAREVGKKIDLAEDAVRKAAAASQMVREHPSRRDYQRLFIELAAKAGDDLATALDPKILGNARYDQFTDLKSALSILRRQLGYFASMKVTGIDPDLRGSIAYLFKKASDGEVRTWD